MVLLLVFSTKLNQPKPTHAKTPPTSVNPGQSTQNQNPKIHPGKTSDATKTIPDVNATQTTPTVQKEANGKVESRPKSNSNNAGLQHPGRPKTGHTPDPQRFMQIKREKTLIVRTQDGHKKKTDTKLKLAIMRAKSILDEGALKPSDDHILCGNVSMECPSTAKIIRIFTSSTFTGMLAYCLDIKSLYECIVR